MTSKSKEMNIPGPKARAYLDRDREVISPSYTRVYPFVMDHGKGLEVWDVDGNRYIDFAAGIAVISTGHSHPKVTKAIKEQADRFLHMSGTDFYYPQQIELAEKLAEIVPMSGAKGIFLPILVRKVSRPRLSLHCFKQVDHISSRSMVLFMVVLWGHCPSRPASRFKGMVSRHLCRK